MKRYNPEWNSTEGGFTLIEIMIVVLIIAILLAIAIPTFLGSRSRAYARSAQSTLHSAIGAEQTYFSAYSSFGSALSSPSIAGIEPGLRWLSSEPAAPGANSVMATVAQVSSSGDSVFLQTQGQDGWCYTLFQTNGAVPTSSVGTAYAVSRPVSGQCSAPPSVTDTSTYPTVTQGSASDHADGGFYTAW